MGDGALPNGQFAPGLFQPGPGARRLDEALVLCLKHQGEEIEGSEGIADALRAPDGDCAHGVLHPRGIGKPTPPVVSDAQALRNLLQGEEGGGVMGNGANSRLPGRVDSAAGLKSE